MMDEESRRIEKRIHDLETRRRVTVRIIWDDDAAVWLGEGSGEARGIFVEAPTVGEVLRLFAVRMENRNRD